MYQIVYIIFIIWFKQVLSKITLSNLYLKNEKYVSRLLDIKRDFGIKSNYSTFQATMIYVTFKV